MESRSIKNGDQVAVHYTGTFADGTEFDSSRGRGPLTFKVGAHQVVPGFEKAVLGHEVGDKYSVTIPAAEAYGESDPRALITLPRAQVPAEIKPEVGMHLTLSTPQGPVNVVVSKLTDEVIVLDANHPMAGKDLTFALEIVSIN